MIFNLVQYCDILQDQVTLFTPQSHIKWTNVGYERFLGGYVADFEEMGFKSPFGLSTLWHRDCIRLYGPFTRVFRLSNAGEGRHIAMLASAGVPLGGKYVELPIPPGKEEWFWRDETIFIYDGDSSIQTFDEPTELFDLQKSKTILDLLQKRWRAIEQSENVNAYYARGGNQVELEMWITSGYIELMDCETVKMEVDNLNPFLDSVGGKHCTEWAMSLKNQRTATALYGTI